MISRCYCPPPSQQEPPNIFQQLSFHTILHSTLSDSNHLHSSSSPSRRKQKTFCKWNLRKKQMGIDIIHISLTTLQERIISKLWWVKLSSFYDYNSHNKHIKTKNVPWCSLASEWKIGELKAIIRIRCIDMKTAFETRAYPQRLQKMVFVLNWSY